MNAPPIRRWLVEAARRIDATLGPARIERVVLPPLLEKPGKEGEFCAVQLDDGSVGLAFALLGNTLKELHRRGRGGAGGMDEWAHGGTMRMGTGSGQGLAVPAKEYFEGKGPRPLVPAGA